MNEYLLKQKKKRRIIWILIVVTLWCVGLVGLLNQKNNSIDESRKDYWATTGLEFKDVVMFINNKKCRQSLNLALACINGIDSIARLNSFTVVVSTPSPDLVPVEVFEGRSDRSTQLKWKSDLNLKKKFKKIDYTALLEDVHSKTALNLLNSEAHLAGLAINGYLSISTDPHTYIIPISQFNDTLGTSEREEISIGMVLRKVRNEVYVSRVLVGSSAERVGVRRGDKILSINSKSINANNLEQAKLLLRGELKSSVFVSLVRDSELFNYQIPRESIVVRSAEVKIIKKSKYSIGVLSLSKFALGSCAEMRNQIINLMDSKVSGAILDLRDNGGGQLIEAGCIANLFLGKNKVVYQTKYLNGRIGETYITHENAIYKGPLSVLVNSNTASAAEILAGALKDHNRSLIVGEKTFGKGSFQAGRIWDKNSLIALFETQGLYYLPSGKSAQLVGITPDIETQSTNPQGVREGDMFINAIPYSDGSSKALSLNNVSDTDFKQTQLQICRTSYKDQELKSHLHLQDEKIATDQQLSGAWEATVCLGQF
jgi:carboxyl-terminal processing protease